MRTLMIFLCAAIVCCAQSLAPVPAHAAGTATAAASASSSESDSGLPSITKFTESAQMQRGLFTVWRKDSKVYFELAKNQLDKDFIQSAVPVNGLGGYFVEPGAFDYFAARVIRFSRNDNQIVITWPNTSFIAPSDSAAERAVQSTFTSSVVGVGKIVAEDPVTGNVVFDASPFLGDVIDLSDTLKQALQTNPEQQYRLNPEQSAFGPSKAFPKNVLLDVRQTWETSDPSVVDNVPDPRTLQFRVDYNFIEPPDDSDYMPRLADDRVGFFDVPYLDFANNTRRTRQTRYIVRWNMQPSDPTKSISPAKHPMVFYLSNTIPEQYRPAIRDAVLAWNGAFQRIGISNAIQVLDQPNDPTWDADDIRYNVIRWLTESNGGGFAEAQIVPDPRTGEEFHTGVIVDADIMLGGSNIWRYLIDPARSHAPRSFAEREAQYATGMQEQRAYGLVALNMMGMMTGSNASQQYNYDFLKSILLHEAGHDMGLQHNFIGSEAYTMKQLQSKAFTARYGVATSVMEYSPLNLWPKGTNQGSYWQTVLGPYDYYAIHWGYARIPGARTPQDERPTLNRWASQWSNPMYRFASDEDVSWADGHAIDPRVNQWDLSTDNLGWCEAQMKLDHGLLSAIDNRFPRYGEEYEAERQAFGSVARQYARCAVMVSHYVGGQYISRAHRGDPGSSAPLVPVSRSDEQRAWSLLDRYLFSDTAWHLSPATLNHLTYQEWGTFNNAAWAYSPPPRHDVAIVDAIGAWQLAALDHAFQPLLLQRLSDFAVTQRPGQTMSLMDLFDWAQSSVYGDLTSRNLRSISVIHRNLQQSYARMLLRLVNSPLPGTPYDAQSLARAKLVSLTGDLEAARKRPLDEITRAHLDELQHVVNAGLEARTIIPPSRY